MVKRNERQRIASSSHVKILIIISPNYFNKNGWWFDAIDRLW